MSIDDEIEQQAYTAINKVDRMGWPVQRERIMKNIVLTIMQRMGWTEVHLKPEGQKDDGRKD